MNSLAAFSTETTPAAVQCDPDARLQASRRVDWRFLLPEAGLGDTVYAGCSDSLLIDALRQFSTRLTILEPGASRLAKSSPFALAVANNPSRSELCQAADLLSPGGFLYVEVDRRWSRQWRARHPHSSHRPRSVRSCLAMIQQCNLSQPQVHWHWPNFELCNEMIPLGQRHAVVCAMNRRGSGWRAWWKKRLGQALLETGLIAGLVPCFSVLAQRSS